MNCDDGRDVIDDGRCEKFFRVSLIAVIKSCDKYYHVERPLHCFPVMFKIKLSHFQSLHSYVLFQTLNKIIIH